MNSNTDIWLLKAAISANFKKKGATTPPSLSWWYQTLRTRKLVYAWRGMHCPSRLVRCFLEFFQPDITEGLALHPLHDYE